MIKPCLVAIEPIKDIASGQHVEIGQVDYGEGTSRALRPSKFIQPVEERESQLGQSAIVTRDRGGTEGGGSGLDKLEVFERPD